MKIIITSDSHDNITNIDTMIKYANKKGIKKIFHCGDVCALDTLVYISNNFKGDIYHALGNGDRDHEIVKKDYKNWHSLGEIGVPSIKGVDKSIAITHYPWLAKEMAESGKYDFIFYGHTHKPWEETIKKTKILNPGTLAGISYRATFAIWETDNDKFILKIL
jgi:putative phosphoesterase